MPSPSVAVVVLHYERPHLLSECLLSVDSNDYVGTGPRIVVDNASPGGPPDLPAGWGLVQANRNGGYGAGMNLGISHAGQADYVLLLTHDVVLRPGCIRGLVTHSMEAGPLTLSGPLLFDRAREVVYSSGGEVRGLRWAFPHRQDTPPPHEVIRPVRWLDGAALLLSRPLLQVLGSLPEFYFLYFEDVDLGLSTAEAGGSVILVPTAIASQSPVGGSSYLRTRNRLYLVRRHAPRLTVASNIVGLPLRGLVEFISGRPREAIGTWRGWAAGCGRLPSSDAQRPAVSSAGRK